MSVVVTKTEEGCKCCGLNMPEDFEPYYIDEPCFNCGSYGHFTEYCKMDTIHSCGLTHNCAARRCNCTERYR